MSEGMSTYAAPGRPFRVACTRDHSRSQARDAFNTVVSQPTPKQCWNDFGKKSTRKTSCCWKIQAMCLIRGSSYITVSASSPLPGQVAMTTCMLYNMHDSMQRYCAHRKLRTSLDSSHKDDSIATITIKHVIRAACDMNLAQMAIGISRLVWMSQGTWENSP